MVHYCRQSSANRSFFRITSYNVCYTKLLRYRYKILASVIPFGTSQNYRDIIRSKDSIPEKISFFPELQGLTISGKLIAPDSGHKAGRIFCSILDSTNYFASKTTRSDGSFQFELPDRYGMHKVALTAAVITSYSIHYTKLYDFCKRHKRTGRSKVRGRKHSGRTKH